jgi:hypothetical protein
MAMLEVTTSKETRSSSECAWKQKKHAFDPSAPFTKHEMLISDAPCEIISMFTSAQHARTRSYKRLQPHGYAIMLARESSMLLMGSAAHDENQRTKATTS